MERLIEIIKNNLPVIVAVLAFVVAIIIVVIVCVCQAKKKKQNGSQTDNSSRAKEPAASESKPEPELGEVKADTAETQTQPVAETEQSVAETDAALQETAAAAAEEIADEKPVTEPETAVADKENLMKNDKKETVKPKTAAKPAAKTATAAKPAPKTTAKSAAKPAPKATAKPAPKTAEPKPTENKGATGKWIIKEKGEGEFVAFLYANNGELILTSEIYASEDSARVGIDTIRKNLESGTFVSYKDKNKNCYFKLKSVKNRILCVSETYRSESLALRAEESVKRFASSPVQEEVEKDITVIKYVLPKKEPPLNADSAYSGKWKIEQDGDAYMAKLFASNGELLLNSENYASEASAKSAVATITANGIAGNFIIDSDKKGRYFFKLRSAQKATLCVGETYAQLSACQSAIESVRRFLKTAKLVED